MRLLVPLVLCSVSLLALSTWLQYASPGGTGGQRIKSVVATALSDKKEQQITRLLTEVVPQLQELYFAPVTGGYVLVATAAIGNVPDLKIVAEEISSRYLTAVYHQLQGVPVIYASLYVEQSGNYVLAAGLGYAESQKLALHAFASDQGTALFDELARVNQYTTNQADQGFAQFSDSPGS